MKYGILATTILFMLDRYNYENLTWLEISLPFAISFIIEFVRFVQFAIKELDKKSRLIRSENLKEKWRIQKIQNDNAKRKIRFKKRGKHV